MALTGSTPPTPLQDVFLKGFASFPNWTAYNTRVPAPEDGVIVYIESDNGYYGRVNGSWRVLYREWAAYTPTLSGSVTNPNLGSSGAAIGSYCVVGGTVVAKVRLAFGGTGVAAGSGTYRVSLPLPAVGGDVFLPAGEALVYDSSANTNYVAVASLESTTAVGMRSHGSTGEVGGASPIGFASGDQLRLNLQYRAA